MAKNTPAPRKATPAPASQSVATPQVAGPVGSSLGLSPTIVPVATAPPASADVTPIAAATAARAARAPRKAPAKKAPPAFIPSEIAAAIDYAAQCRMADLQRYFRLDEEQITVQEVVISSLLAEKLLTGNVNNRPLKPANVKALHQRQTNGQWDWSVPIVIIMDTQGKVHNGQHCLHALIASEKLRKSSQDMLEHFAERGMETELAYMNGIVVRGLPETVANHWDRNMVRSHGDIVFRQHLLTQEKRTNGQLVRMSGIVATTAKFAWLRVTMGKKQRFSVAFGHEDMTEFLEYYPDIVTSVEFVFDEDASSPKGTPKLSKRLTLPQAALLHWLMANSAYDGLDHSDEPTGVSQAEAIAREKADMFLKQLATGGVTGGKDPVSVLAHWLASRPSGGGNAAIEATFDGCLIAADAFLKGQTIEPADLNIAPKVQVTDEAGHLLYVSSTGVEGYLDDKSNFHWTDENGEAQKWSKKTRDEAKSETGESEPIELTPVTLPSYPHLGGLDVPPSDDDEETEVTEEASDVPEAETVPA